MGFIAAAFGSSSLGLLGVSYGLSNIKKKQSLNASVSERDPLEKLGFKSLFKNLTIADADFLAILVINAILLSLCAIVGMLERMGSPSIHEGGEKENSMTTHLLKADKKQN